ncbi:glutamate racemase [Elusimicrobiota bacterium]
MKRPVGIFDSGLGGLTVMSEIMALMPTEDIIYFGDTAHVPYGSKSKESVVRFSTDISHFLISQKIKMLVVACNTASAFALPYLKKKFNVPITGVIIPGAEAAISSTRNKRIGIIGTEGTIKSSSYANAIKSVSSGINVFSQACPLFVPIVEEGWVAHKVSNITASEYLKPLIARNIDTLVLGCTHYPLIKEVLRKTVSKNTVLIDSAEFTAREVFNTLDRLNLGAKSKTRGKYKYFVSDSPQKFKSLGQRFLKHIIKSVKKVNLE